MNGRFNVCELAGDQMKTATDLALEFVKRRIPTSFRDEKDMREMCAAGKSSTYDAVIFGHTEGRREALEMAQPVVAMLKVCEDRFRDKDLDRWADELELFLAKYEEWKDGK